MDAGHQVHKLVRSANNRKLSAEKTVTLKEIQRYDFNPKAFDNYLVSEKYGVFKQKMFYFYDATDEPFPEGILEADELMDEDRTQAARKQFRGPFTFSGSNRFYEVFRQSKFKSFMRIYTLPDMVQKTLINDFGNYVDMSTFLEDGNILMRSRSRFMIFSKEGFFKDEITFNDDACAEEEDALTIEDLRAKLTGDHQDVGVQTKKSPILDFKGNIY